MCWIFLPGFQVYERNCFSQHIHTNVCVYTLNTLNSSEYVYAANSGGGGGCGGNDDDDEHNDDEHDIDVNDVVLHGSERDWRRQTLLTSSQFRLG